MPIVAIVAEDANSSIMSGRPPVNLVQTAVQDIGLPAIRRNTRISSKEEEESLTPHSFPTD